MHTSVFNPPSVFNSLQYGFSQAGKAVLFEAAAGL
ncbi:RidA superfamily protein [Pseudomonas chlororaphis]|uniref:RidA superfamily protein n=1 Tax=Pseudomonas chlororaphis TaxID=587753 RepID=A0A3G7TKG9_9PSED|nr:RidA superfamily protein [Pseudomonas chlororaphis]